MTLIQDFKPLAADFDTLATLSMGDLPKAVQEEMWDSAQVDFPVQTDHGMIRITVANADSIFIGGVQNAKDGSRLQWNGQEVTPYFQVRRHEGFWGMDAGYHNRVIPIIGGPIMPFADLPPAETEAIWRKAIVPTLVGWLADNEALIARAALTRAVWRHIQEKARTEAEVERRRAKLNAALTDAHKSMEVAASHLRLAVERVKFLE